MTDPQTRRRWINIGEIIGLAALIISALGLWLTWKSSSNDRPTRVIEQRQAIPLTLRAKREDDGKRLNITPVESTQALEGLTLTIPGSAPISVGSDGELAASDVQAALTGRDKEPKDRTLAVRARIEAHYVELGADRRTTGSYSLRYMWKNGGLFGGRTLHLVGLSR